MQPGVTVVIPTHLRDRLLAGALASILQQTLRPDEILIVDDVGCESTAALVRCVSESSDVTVRHLVRHGTPGAAASRQFGTDRASFPLVAYLDDDDLWFPWHLREVRAALVSGGVDAVAAPRIEFGSGSAAVRSLVRPRMPRSMFEMFVGGTHVGGSNLAVRSDVVRELGWDPALTTCEDGDLVIRMLLSGLRVFVTETPSVAVRHHLGPRLRSEYRSGWARIIAKHRPLVPRSAVVLQTMRDSQAPRGGADLFDVAVRWVRTLRASIEDPEVTDFDVMAVFLRLLRLRTSGLASRVRYRRSRWHLARLLERTEQMAAEWT